MNHLSIKSIKLYILLLFTVFAISQKASAQVTIGSDINPQSFSLLEIATDNIKGGIRLPQLSQDEIDELKSKILSLTDEQKVKANGLIVFNMETMCINLWKNSGFKSLCGDLENAELTVKCEELVVFPNDNSTELIPVDYKQGLPLDNSVNYIKIPVTVTEPGNYTVTATTGNGYSFLASGTLLDTGNYTLTLNGQGTPIYGNENYLDNLTITVNGNIVTECNTFLKNKIPVAPRIPKSFFTVNCEKSVVNGTYLLNNDLDVSSNTIALSINVASTGRFSISGEVNGMSFVESGEFTKIGEQQLTIAGSGAPTTLGVNTISIVADTKDGMITCEQTINVTYRSVNVLGLGHGAYQPGTATSNQSALEILRTKANFGNSAGSTVMVQGININNGGEPSSASLENSINSTKADIIVIGYNFSPSDNSIKILADFVKNKNGVILAFMEGSAANRLINEIYGTAYSMTGRNAGGAVYMFKDMTNDPVLNGPFKNISNTYWGEDATATQHLSNLPDGAILYTNGNSGAGLNEVTSFRDGNLGFLWCGDGGFLAGNQTEASAGIWPCKNIGGIPVAKTNYSKPTHNSFFYANAIAWAIDYVHKNKPL